LSSLRKWLPFVPEKAHGMSELIVFFFRPPWSVARRHDWRDSGRDWRFWDSRYCRKPCLS
jgi:hypothetical protein